LRLRLSWAVTKTKSWLSGHFVTAIVGLNPIQVVMSCASLTTTIIVHHPQDTITSQHQTGLPKKPQERNRKIILSRELRDRTERHAVLGLAYITVQFKFCNRLNKIYHFTTFLTLGKDMVILELSSSAKSRV
jgi:hypothetical protein